MKNKFATIDLSAIIHDLADLKSMRVVNVYDINSKTYLIKLQKPNDKAFILFESGIRIHKTLYDWPKAMFPSSFSMKFRKHINQKRLINVSQVGMDRIVDLKFGEAERSCHVIVELYDRGNIVLTDHEYIILNILRPRTDKDNDVRFSVKEKYPIENARKTTFLPSIENILLFLENAKNGELLKKALIRNVPFGSLMLDHCLIKTGFSQNGKIGVNVSKTTETAKKILDALQLAEKIVNEICLKKQRGFIAYKTTTLHDGSVAETFDEYYPFDFCQFREPSSQFQVKDFDSFSLAVDKYYSSLESQKVAQKILHVENETNRRLENIKKDHEQRIIALDDVQSIQEKRGLYIQYNKDLVNNALLLIRTALATKTSWDQIAVWLEQLKLNNVAVAQHIIKLDLASNIMKMQLTNPCAEFYDSDNSNDSNDSNSSNNNKKQEEPLVVDIDIGLNADQNVKKYFTHRRNAIEKKTKTLAASKKALKSAQIQLKTKIKQVQIKTNEIRTRKIFWFEKFYWFISSDNYLIVAGRDAQQNELLVKRYIRPGDIYVHAEIQGASSVLIRNRVSGANADTPPPRTLNEAATMAICYSTAWEAKVVVSAWWVRHDQVSRTAPTGEFLPTGSFMIRGFGLLFRLDEESIQNRMANSKLLTEDKIDFSNNTEEETMKDLTDEDDNISSSSNTEKDVDKEFPDVNLDIGKLILSIDNDSSTTNQNDDYSLINLGVKDPRQSKKTETEKYLETKAQQEQLSKKQKSNILTTENDKATINIQKPLTKRQKHKLDKIQKKYKDQDEEERELRLKILGSAGNKEKNNKKNKKNKNNFIKSEDLSKNLPKSLNIIESKTIVEKKIELEKLSNQDENAENKIEENNQKDQEELDVLEEETSVHEDELIIIDSLASCVQSDESPLYVLGVCAPYSALQKYKYKVKITPGSGKRGKAVKMAFALFLRDKTITESERVLIKTLSLDDRIAACLPGKIRVSAPLLLNTTKGK